MMKTLAIVIGCNSYPGHELRCAISDAQAIRDLFGRMGYHVLYYEDITADQCADVIQAYDAEIEQHDQSIFYFAGHGFQLDDENYLASVDCELSNPIKAYCNRNCIRLQGEILDIYKRHPNAKNNIVILDACRTRLNRSVGDNLIPTQAPQGTLIAYSTSPGESARDGGLGDHSIYTGSFLDCVGMEPKPAETLFKDIRKKVYELTDGNQTTWEHTSLIEDFVFNAVVNTSINQYEEFAIKDAQFVSTDDIGNIIVELRSHNWYRQNPAISSFLQLNPEGIDKNLQFLFGRNILQSYVGNSTYAAYFFTYDFRNKILRYSSENGENHVLNGILYEMYFNSLGEFRYKNLKCRNNQMIFGLIDDQAFSSSFQFINIQLQPFTNFLFYVPLVEQEIIVNIGGELMEPDTIRPNNHYIITSLTVNGVDIKKDLYPYVLKWSFKGLKEAILRVIFAPVSKVKFAGAVAEDQATFELQR